MNETTFRNALFLCGFAIGAANLPSAAFAQVNPSVDPTTGGEAGVDSDGDTVHDNGDVEPCDPRVSARTYAPAYGTWGMMLFEDNWPSKGDFDFNDLVLGYNETLDFDSTATLRGVRFELRVMAVGAKYNNGLAVRVPNLAKSSVTFTSLTVDGVGQNVVLRASESEAVITVAPDMHALFGEAVARPHINTDPNLPAHPYVDIVLELHFDGTSNVSASDAPFDIFLFNNTRGTEVHRPAYRGTSTLGSNHISSNDDGTTASRAFVTKNGIPFALEFGEQVLYPKEDVSIDSLFPAIVQFGNSNGTQAVDFFRNPVSGPEYGNVSPGSLSAAAAVDVSCFAPNPGVCGAAQGNGTLTAPTTNLCSRGTASVASSSGGLHRWTCSGNYSTPTACDAPDWVCAPNTATDCSASISNGSGSQLCNGSGTGLGTCNLTACNSGYYQSGNGCLAQLCVPNSSQSCAIANGAGSQTCNNIGSLYGGCAVTSCDAGFTQVGNTCQNLTPTGTNVYYQCQNAVPASTNTGYVVFVQNVNNLVANTPAQLLSACISYGFKGLATSDSRTHRDTGYGINNSSQIHQAVYCHNCYPSSGHEWYYNRSSSNTCTHASGSASGTAGKNMATYIFNSQATTYACMTFDQNLDASTAFGNGSTNDATHPWYTEASGQDPCNRTRVGGHTGDNYNGTPDYLLCASQTIQP